ncbi:MAG TPA: malic enzyme-like NAD(P)-binding protein, partial [Pirellulaceae bacterium]|nr:malic enzyme-like NAD(P)-binding protein [Pirellulaceae bacterium]
LLMKYLGGIDAVPLCLGTKDPAQLVQAVRWLEPSFGGVNLEDISQPKCFGILDELRRTAEIPVWHDDQQGTATVVLAGLLNALTVVGKSLADVRITMLGVGAANVATYRLLVSQGVAPGAIVMCDRRGALNRQRADIEQRQDEFRDKWRICCDSNATGVRGDVADALRGADVLIAFSSSGPGVIRPEWIKQMNADAIVFACANPTPEIWPWEAAEAGAKVVATGRSDFPNQVNNSLAFPGIFRGVLDVRARTITDSMALAAARQIAGLAAGRLRPDFILPRMDEWDLHPQVAAATGVAAQTAGVARLEKSFHELVDEAEHMIRRARELQAAVNRQCEAEFGAKPDASRSSRQA